MRLVALLALATLSSCSKASEERAHAEPTAVNFDGALETAVTAKVAHGERLSRVLGCRGCHGDNLQGKEWDNDPKGYGLLWTSNLTQAVPAMSDAQLRAVLTKGIHPTRNDLWAMPAHLFQHLSEPDLTALIVYLRTLKPAGTPTPAPINGPKAVAEIKSGMFEPEAARVRETANVLPIDVGKQYATGRYITAVTCAECHGPKLEGSSDQEHKVPDLGIAAAYSRDEFRALTTEGVAKGNRKIDELMTSVGKSRFSHLTQHERDAVYDYLKARAERPQ